MGSSTPHPLHTTWIESLAPYGASREVVDAALDVLRMRYRQPHRHYHTLDHLDEVLSAVDALADLAERADVVRLAVMFHDAVYDPGSPTNEDDSATLALRMLRELSVPEADAEAVATLVRMTADHATATTPDAIVLADADRWILGSPPERYERYAADVRAEYAHLDDDRWRLGRSALLGQLIKRDRLYLTDRFHTDLEPQARRNLTTELESL